MPFKSWSLFAALLLSSALASAEAILETISVDQSVKLIQTQNSNKEFTILDVRTPKEHKQGHLENAKLLNFYDGEFKENLARLDKNTPYLIYCRSGGRSGKALSVMEEMGFTQVYNMSGDSLSEKKPSPMPLLHICQQLDVSPHKTIMIGDSLSDAKSASAAKIPFILLEQGYSQGVDLDTLGAIAVLPNIQSVQDWFQPDNYITNYITNYVTK